MKPVYALAAVLAIHLALAMTLVSPGVVFSGEPIASLDYSLHFVRVWITDGLLSEHGRIWGYNPFFLAGYPAGTVFDVNNHFIELFCVVLHRIGFALPTTFNLFVFLALILAPVMMWAAARNFGLSPWQQVAAAAIATLLWFTDREVGLTWRVGVIASGVAMYTLPFALSCLHRYIERRSWGWLSAFVVTGSLVSLVHPLSFLFFFGAVAVYLMVRAPRFDPRFWGAMVLFAGVVLVVNLMWIVPLLQHLPLKTTSGYHWIGDLRMLFHDLTLSRGSGLRLIIYAFGLGGLWTWWRDGRRELVELIGVPVVILTIFGYLSGHLAIFRDYETYRNNLVVSFLLIPAAAVGIDRGLVYLRTLAPKRRAVVAGAVSVVAVLLLAKNLMWFMPYARLDFRRYALGPLRGAEMRTVKALADRVEPGERVLVEYWPLGAMVPWYTGREVIGGPYPLVWMPHNFANYTVFSEVSVRGETRLFGRPLSEAKADLGRNLDLYGIGWVVAYTEASKTLYDGHEGVTPVAEYGRQKLYRVDEPSGLLIRGDARVEGRFGTLMVDASVSGPVTLKYHWSPTLIAEPEQPVLPCTMGDDPVPFIHLPDAPNGHTVLRDRGTIASISSTDGFSAALPNDAPACMK